MNKTFTRLVECFCDKKIADYKTTFHSFEEYDCRIFYYNNIAVFRTNEEVKTFQRHKVFGRRFLDMQSELTKYFLEKGYTDITGVR